MGTGKGSLEMRDKDGYIWRLIVSQGYKKDGTKLREKKTVHVEGKTIQSRKKAAEKQLALFLAEIEQGTYFAPSKMTIDEFIDKWLTEHGKSLEDKTYYRYAEILNGRVSKSLGQLKLDQIKPLHLIDFYDNLQEVGIREDTKYKATPDFKKAIESIGKELPEIASLCGISKRTLNGILSGDSTNKAVEICAALKLKLDKVFVPSSKMKPLSNRTITHYHRILSTMLSDAVRWGMLKENPCSKVQPPKVIQKDMECLDEDGVAQLIECLQQEPIKTQAMIMTSLVTGCRRGELAALQWPAVDLDNKTIYIRQSIAYTPEKGMVIKKPKTLASTRKIAIPDTAVTVLKQYKVWQMERRLKVGEQWLKTQREQCEKDGVDSIDPSWVFTTWDGYGIHPDTMTSTFKKFLNHHGLPDIRLHDLRHTACTMLLHAGLNVRAVASRMGHANPNVTLSVYAHALKSADQQAANLIESVINGMNRSMQK